MSSKLPILLVVAGVIYFISTASAEDGDDVGCMDEAACNYDDTATVDSGDCKYGDECGMFSTLEGWHLAVGAVVLLLILK